MTHIYMLIEQIHVYSASILSRAAVDPPEKCYFEWRFADGPIMARAAFLCFFGQPVETKKKERNIYLQYILLFLFASML